MDKEPAFCEFCDRTEEDGEAIFTCPKCNTMFCGYHESLDGGCPHCGCTEY